MLMHTMKTQKVICKIPVPIRTAPNLSTNFCQVQQLVKTQYKCAKTALKTI